MGYEYNDPVLKPRRQELRNKSTEAEKLLWEKLKRSQLKGFKFVRQYSVGPYILDFFCPQARLAIELDGGHHGSEEGKEYDVERTSYLSDHDVKVIRFWNDEVLKEIETVVAKILSGLFSPPS
ncbi:MAG: endonuclease domain-containing protein [Deltaproteobacteria bacterium]|nr:endonuclease domain-containing protein [Deltaproteobacteria bacterium]MBI4373368.1 endonuclease domain-containing protein [Deltaproteobacteria bacterium]